MKFTSCNIDPMYFKESKILDNLYLLPCSLVNREIMYSPLRGTAFMVDSNTASHLMSGNSDNILVEDISQKLSPINYELLQHVDISVKEISQN